MQNKILDNIPQNLTDEQQAQARANIGAIGGVRVIDSSGTTDLVPDSQGRVTVDLTGLSVPLVRAKFQDGAWSKISGDDGFIRQNPWGVDSLFLPESCWWSIGMGLSVVNNTPRDLIQHLQMKYEWNNYISINVPPITYEEVNLPSMTYEADFTRENTNNRYMTTLYKKDGATGDWLSVALTAYHDTLPNDLEWALWVNIYKVRDA